MSNLSDRLPPFFTHSAEDPEFDAPDFVNREDSEDSEDSEDREVRTEKMSPMQVVCAALSIGYIGVVLFFLVPAVIEGLPK
jgi:hypothetical protein